MVGFCEAMVATVMEQYDWPSWDQSLERDFYDSLRMLQRGPESMSTGVTKDKSGYSESDEPLTDRSCVHCAHYRTQASDTPSRGHRCERPQFGVTRDYIFGSDIPNSRDAYEERAAPRRIMVEKGTEIIPSADAHERCGPEGKFWSQSGF